MPVTKPTNLIRWADVSGTISEPASGKKNTGYVSNDVPGSGEFNWFFNGAYKWFAYLNDLVNQAFTWVGAHVFNGPVTFGADPTFPARTFIKPGAGGGAPSLGSGWARSGITYRDLNVFLDPMGCVHFQGILQTTSGSPAGVIFTLPAGYFPPTAGADLIFMVPVFASGGAVSQGEIDISGGGTVDFTRVTGTNATNDIVVFNFSYYPAV